VFLGQQIIEDPYTGIAEKIKSDLAATLQRKGVAVSRIKVNMKPDIMNLEVCITGRRHPRYVKSR